MEDKWHVLLNCFWRREPAKGCDREPGSSVTFGEMKSCCLEEAGCLFLFITQLLGLIEAGENLPCQGCFQ